MFFWILRFFICCVIAKWLGKLSSLECLSKQGIIAGFLYAHGFLYEFYRTVETVYCYRVFILFDYLLQASFHLLEFCVSEFSFENRILYPVEITAQELQNLDYSLNVYIVHDYQVHFFLPKGILILQVLTNTLSLQDR